MGNADSLLQEILIHWETEKYRADIEIERMKKSYNREWTKRIQNVVWKNKGFFHHLSNIFTTITNFTFFLRLIKSKWRQSVWSNLNVFDYLQQQTPFPIHKKEIIFAEYFLSRRWENIPPLKWLHWINFILNITLIYNRVTIISIVRRKMFQVWGKRKKGIFKTCVCTTWHK